MASTSFGAAKKSNRCFGFLPEQTKGLSPIEIVIEIDLPRAIVIDIDLDFPKYVIAILERWFPNAITRNEARKDCHWSSWR